MKFPLLLLVAASFSFAQWGGGGGKSLNDYKKESVSGRDIHVYAPSNLAPKSPLLISCHGMDQDPNYQQSNTHWEAVADTAGFVVVYPRGGTGMSTWDISGDKDTKWVVQIIEQMVKEYDIDQKRVYLSGFSMGGMFTYHAMSKIADKIAAFAPTSGTNVMGASKAMRPVPIIHPHGTSDDVLNYSQVEGFIKNYRDQFHCPSQAEVQNNYPNSENRATMYTWGPCDEGVYIKHLKLEGRGHSPSKADVSDIWNFVKQYSLDGASITPSIEVPTNRDSVFNGSFSDSLKLAGWTLQQHSGEGSLKLTEGKAEINVTKTGTNAYDVQMIQNGVHYEKGQSYKVTFDAYASVARTLEVNIEKDTDPWTSYLGEAKTFDLGTEKKNFEILFTMNEATDENGRVSFNAGLATGSVFIDNVVLSKVEGTLGLAKNVRVLAGERTLSVYDMNGAFVCNLKGVRVNDVQSKLNSMKLEKGLYVVKNGSFSRIYSVK
ncbi:MULTISPECIES: carbohydrate binding domain-containing protein [Fibrobacter]|uniref:Esterase, PHB depolymerase family n=1 Tax=Fibrobacter succinogenes TaxID=833 RepID=A0A380RX70_FIBSU|nr:carbohydrate binding domain-containing protein [Fibrobacter succinogenes]PWJ37654.1 poly(hydroxyalkanoate) depolymerase family esterase [Fibrobacter succinogenes subsp. elongatus]SUQ19901.1 esterase, PHB depolymerase family [Fibrobacter succinogenes]